MSVSRTYHCDGPDCGGDGGETTPTVHAETASPPPHLPSGFLEVRGDREGVHPIEGTAHFCSWDCLMKFAAARPEDTVIELGGPDG